MAKSKSRSGAGKNRFERYRYYELAVQSPEVTIDWLVGIFRELRGRYPKRLREDFCGTFALSSAWVKRNRKNSAICLDVDRDPLTYGKKKHWESLTRDQRTRLNPVMQNVLSVTHEKSDVVLACNFSFFIFKERAVLKSYLMYCLKSLGEKGMVVLELAGGPGMIEKTKDHKPIFSGGRRLFTYIWDQISFNPIRREAKYAIHFRLAGGKSLENAFTYAWRMWTIPEVRELLLEAGFSESLAYWETEHRGMPTGEFIRAELGDNAYSWTAYVVGLK